jgi:hypothetical protein
MAVLENYSDLESSLLGWLNLATDQAGVTAARIEEAVKFAEAALYRNLRSYEAQTYTTGSTTTANGQTLLTLPADWIAGQDIELLIDSYYWPITATGGYAIVRNDLSSIEIRPYLSSDRTYRLRYWAKFTPIAGAPTISNWLLSNHPDAYLTGSKMWLHRFMQDEAAAAAEEEQFNKILDQLRESSISREWFTIPAMTYGGGTP